MAKTIFCCILVALACGCVQAADSSITDLKSANFQQLKLEASSLELNERQCNKWIFLTISAGFSQISVNVS